MKITAILFCLLCSASAFAEGIVYTWAAPTVRADGVRITGAVSYVLQGSYGSAFTASTEVKSATTTATIDNLVPGTYYARIATIEDGRQGPWSPTVSVVLPALPAAPASLRGSVVYNVNLSGSTVNVTIQ